MQTPGTSGRPKIKLKSSQPPTPATEAAPPLAEPLGPPPTKPKRPYHKKEKADGDDASKKRSAADDIAPLAKRPTISLNVSRRNSIKLDPDGDDLVAASPAVAAPRITLKKAKPHADRRSSGPRFKVLPGRKGQPAKRPVGVGYDSEDSEAEVDPLIEAQFVLRMQPGDDCEYLRDAINNKTLGQPISEGGADIKLRFLDKEHRRVMLIIRGKSYAAAMVDLPCIIEGMKSWDKRGWWKVADICQMMLVLGPTENDDTAKAHPLPKEVDKNTWAYAHGLTPPMHYVRKRRFRKRASYKTIEHIDEEVERLLAADREAEVSTYKIVDDSLDAAAEDDYEDEEEPESYLSTTENGYGQYVGEPEEDEELFDDDLEAELLASLATGDADTLAPHTGPNAPPLPAADAAANLGAVETAIAEAVAAPATASSSLPHTSAPTKTANQAASSDEESDEDDEASDVSSDEDDDDDPTAIDEDLVERQRELEGQKQDIEELERRISQARLDIAAQKNQLLKARKVKTLEHLEEELRVKKRAVGLGDEDDE